MSGPHSAIVESLAPAIDVPTATLPRYIRSLARERGDQLAIVEGPTGRRLTYGDLDSQIGRIAAGLVAHGFQPGHTLLMVAPNSPEWIVLALGALAAGGVVSGANPASSASDIAYQIRDSGACWVFTIESVRYKVREAASAVHRAPLVVLGDPEGPDISYHALAPCADPEPAMPEDPDALAALPYSSGTSGLPKGVRLSHRTILSNLLQTSVHLREPSEKRSAFVLTYLPMFHILGFALQTLLPLVEGRTLVTLPRFEPDSFLRAIQDFRITHLGLVPPVLHFLVHDPRVANYDLSSLKRVNCGAAPLGKGPQQQAAVRLRCIVSQGFGMTESSGAISLTRPGRERAGSSGELLPGTQARVVDPATLADVPRGSPGEIWFRGPQAFLGYHGQPEATAATITRDGWVRTGDIGYIDTDGYVYLTDRLKELIKVKGYQVAPAELEALLYAHPHIADAAVIGRAHERCGEVPVAYVVPRGALDVSGLRDWVAARVPEYKQLADVVICEVIAKTPAGKILRRELRLIDARREGSARVKMT
jgi:acyl-CoA synthetase (AMP-forming)/AMP-acid ligase II